jgi:hypothetical protein
MCIICGRYFTSENNLRYVSASIFI